MDSDYCYGTEMQRALERHERGEVQVIPIILRPVYFEGIPFSKLQALPTDAKAVMSSSWQYQDEAYVNVTKGIHKVVEKLSIPRQYLVQKQPSERGSTTDTQHDSWDTSASHNAVWEGPVQPQSQSCPACGDENELNAANCYHCGMPLYPQNSSSKSL